MAPVEAPSKPAETRADRWIMLGLVLVFAGVYLRTLCPTVFWYDSAEYAAVSATLGIAHPPGYPLYTLLGRLFVALVPGEPAFAVNVMSACFGALAVGLLYLVGRRLGARPFGAASGSAVLGSTTLFWSQALVAEVYTPGLSALLLTLWLLLLARDQARDLPAVVAAYVAGLGLGLHYFLATCGLGLALLAWSREQAAEPAATPWQLLRPLGPRLRRSALSLLALVLGALVFLYLPLRSAQHPAIDPNQPAIAQHFLWMVSGGNYGVRFGQLPWGAGLARLSGMLYDQLLVVGLLLAAVGAVALARRAWVTLVALVAMVLGNTLTFLRYDVHDPEVFFMPTVAIGALLAGLGADAALAQARRGVGARRPWIAGALAVALAAFPAAQLGVGWSKVDLHDYRAARLYGERLCRELPQGAVIANYTSPPEWKNDAVFAMYFQAALGQRPDVRVLPSPDLLQLQQLVASGTPVYCYVPLKNVAAGFVLQKEGALFRLRERRR